MSTELKTSDTEFASAMMAKGADLVSWEPSAPDTGRRRMFWHLKSVDPQWVEDYRTGADKFSAFIHARRMLVNIVKTDERLK